MIHWDKGKRQSERRANPTSVSSSTGCAQPPETSSRLETLSKGLLKTLMFDNGKKLRSSSESK
jgi:hypothetical protein